MGHQTHCSSSRLLMARSEQQERYQATADESSQSDGATEAPMEVEISMVEIFMEQVC